MQEDLYRYTFLSNDCVCLFSPTPSLWFYWIHFSHLQIQHSCPSPPSMGDFTSFSWREQNKLICHLQIYWHAAVGILHLPCGCKRKVSCSYLRLVPPPATWVPSRHFFKTIVPPIFPLSPLSGQQGFSVKGQIVSIWGFVGLMIFVTVFQWNFILKCSQKSDLASKSSVSVPGLYMTNNRSSSTAVLPSVYE